MSGPLVHLAAYEKARALIKTNLGQNLQVGNLINVVEPDLSGVGASFDPEKMSGSLFSQLDKLREAKTTYPLTWATIYACHFFVDCCTLGHMTGDLHRYETRLEPAGELVPNKEAYTPMITDAFVPAEVVRNINEIYTTYRGKAKSLLFLLSGDFRSYVRKIVAYSAANTFNWVKYEYLGVK
jgi:hypothetical protein